MVTDITELTDAALDVFVSVKAGEDVVTSHLTDGERLAVAAALKGAPLTGHEISRCLSPQRNVECGPRLVVRDREGEILTAQENEVDGY